MASASYFLPILKAMHLGQLNILTDTIKLAIVNNNYVFDNLTEFFDTGANDANDPSYNVINATGYTVEQIDIDEDDLFYITTGDGKLGWYFHLYTPGEIGGETNDTCAGVVIFKDTGDLTTSPVIAYIPFDANQVTNGQGLLLNFKKASENGQLRIDLPSQA